MRAPRVSSRFCRRNMTANLDQPPPAATRHARISTQRGKQIRTQIDTNGTVVHFVRHFEICLKGRRRREIVGCRKRLKRWGRREIGRRKGGQVVVGYIGVEILSATSQIFCDFFFLTRHFFRAWPPRPPRPPPSFHPFFHSLLPAGTRTGGVAEPDRRVFEVALVLVGLGSLPHF